MKSSDIKWAKIAKRSPRHKIMFPPKQRLKIKNGTKIIISDRTHNNKTNFPSPFSRPEKRDNVLVVNWTYLLDPNKNLISVLISMPGVSLALEQGIYR